MSRNEAVVTLDAAGNAFGDVAQLSAGNEVSAAVKNDGSVWVWGWAVDLLLIPANNPVPVFDAAGSQLTGASQVAVGGDFVLILKSDGTVWTTRGSTASSDPSRVRAVPMETSAGVRLNGIVAIAAGFTHGLALTSDGRVFSWGTGRIGRSASASQALTPGLVTDRDGATFTGVAGVQAGSYASVLHRRDGSLWSFGDDPRIFAAGTNQGEIFPVQAQGSDGSAFGRVRAISFTHQHALALREDSAAIWGWGVNVSEQLAVQVRSPADTGIQFPAVVVP